MSILLFIIAIIFYYYANMTKNVFDSIIMLTFGKTKVVTDDFYAAKTPVKY